MPLKGLVAAAGALIAFAAASPSSAADLPRKAPPPAPPAPQIYNWTGFYAGVNLGYGFGSDPTTITTVSGSSFPGLATGTAIYSPQSFSIDPKGVIGGGQIGYNWQFAPSWVVGFETDIQGSGMRKQQDCVIPCGLGVLTQSTGFLTFFPVTFSAFSEEHKVDWFGTVRGRFGYAAGPVLVYATGGLAYGEVNRSGNVVG
ncbi:MAG: outer membrane protein, partial [Xanthobacteraceae bacterium]